VLVSLLALPSVDKAIIAGRSMLPWPAPVRAPNIMNIPKLKESAKVVVIHYNKNN